MATPTVSTDRAMAASKSRTTGDKDHPKRGCETRWSTTWIQTTPVPPTNRPSSRALGRSSTVIDRHLSTRRSLGSQDGRRSEATRPDPGQGGRQVGERQGAEADDGQEDEARRR